MQNPEQIHSARQIEVQLIYKYSTGDNIPWNIREFHTPRQFFDANMEVQKRKWAQQKKGEKNNKYVTKRGFYMNYDLKNAKAVPSAFDHGAQKPWDFQNLKRISKHRKVDSKLIKNTYLDKIQINQQKRKSPGICTYNLEKSLEQKQKQLIEEKKRKKVEQERRYYHQDIHFISDGVPGAGNYNPHDTIEKIRQDKNDWHYWVEKHKKENEVISKRNSLIPGSSTYKPMNTTISTFDRISLSPKSKLPGFGTDARFPYTRSEKKKIKQIRPSPNNYKTTLEWKGKSQSPKFKPWNTAIWKGKDYSTISIYN